MHGGCALVTPLLNTQLTVFKPGALDKGKFQLDDRSGALFGDVFDDTSDDHFSDSDSHDYRRTACELQHARSQHDLFRSA